MTRTRVAMLALVLCLAPGVAWSQYAAGEVPPSPPEAIPAPPAQTTFAEPQTGVAEQTGSGQWVYTEQYGWIWMPYSDAYTSVPADGYGQPYQYVYYPAYSAWSWVVAPWIWGIGPWPYFGAYGPVHYGWYGHGWWRTPTHWHYAPHPYHGGGHPYYGGTHAYGGHGHPVNAVRPAPYRGGVVPRGGTVQYRGVPHAGMAPRTASTGHGPVGGVARAPVGNFGHGSASVGRVGGGSFGHGSASVGRAGGGSAHALGGGGRGGHR